MVKEREKDMTERNTAVQTAPVIDKNTLEELSEDIDMLLLEVGITDYKITENFCNNGKRTYLISGLHIEFEDEICFSLDWHGILLENTYVLSGFLKADPIVYKINESTFKLKFKDGEILIQGLPND